MKNILMAAAVVLSLTACGDNTNSDENTTDTTLGGGLTTDTSTSIMNPTDTMGINRDTSRSDRTRITQPADTLRRRDSTR